MYEYIETEIKNVKSLLENYDVEVFSPDGWVEVTDYVEKGLWEEYELQTISGKVVKVSAGHMFETSNGWEFAGDLCNQSFKVLTENGLEEAIIKKTGEVIPIVDITVKHKNHRYFTNGVSSHNTGGGKSIFLCHTAASTLMQGKNVLYISMEMSEEAIAERIDANLMDTPIHELRNISKDVFETRLGKVKAKTRGKLVIKEYPTSSAHVGHFRALIEELKQKKNFTPDLICVDYLNICASARVKAATANSYTIIKSIAEELRALAVEYSVPVLTATQLNRGGASNSDVEMTDTSESMGSVHTFDLYFALIRTEELDELNQVMIKQLKNRYGDLGYYKRFVVGLDTSRMKFYDVEESAQKNIADSGQDEDDKPLFDKSKFGSRLKQERKFNFDD